MNCDDFREILALYVGGECDEDERIVVEAHLAVCSECSREVEEHREARAALLQLREESPRTETVWKGVRHRLFPIRTLGTDWLVRAAAVLVVGVAIGFLGVMIAHRDPAPAAASGARPLIGRGAGVSTPGNAPRSRFVDSSQDSEFPYEHERRKTTSPRRDGGFYLPRAESAGSGVDRDF